MDQQKYLVVFGTRPEAIKMAPVIRCLRESHGKVLVCVTAQHREMLDQVLEVFEIRPDFDLNLMRPAQNLADLLSRVVMNVSTVIQESKPSWVLVHGDTTTALGASLAAFYGGIPVGHVEAGLRSWNRAAPWPEEVNRRMISAATDAHFAPTRLAARNLEAERVDPRAIAVTGNTVVDALRMVKDRICSDALLQKDLERRFEFLQKDKRLILMTSHRRESIGEKMRGVFRALREVAEAERVEILYPVHLNPQVRAVAEDCFRGTSSVYLVEPLEYVPFVYLMMRCHLVITDSGGIQEEAPAFGKPVLVTRDVTERPEGVEAGTLRLVGTEPSVIKRELRSLLNDSQEYGRMAALRNPYGDGEAAVRIRAVLEGRAYAPFQG